MSNARELAELGGSYGSGGFVGMKNRIINGDMRIDQRNAGASVTPNDGAYSVDRWMARATVGGKFSLQQNAGAVTPPAGFTKYLGATVLAAYTPGASEIFAIDQRIEGFNTIDLAWGTASAQAVTLSFWVRSSLTGTFSGSLKGGSNYGFTFTINSANTWEYKTVTIPGSTTGTWDVGNTTGIVVNFSLGGGSNFQGAAGSWTSTDIYHVTGSTSVVGTNGATFYITGVQLERGSTATSFDYRPYGTELALCQRYYYRVDSSDNVWANLIGGGYASSSTSAYFIAQFPTVMRSSPTLLANIGNSSVGPGFSSASPSGYATDQATRYTLGFTVSGLTGGTTGFGVRMYSGGVSTGQYLSFSAEL